MNPNSTIIGYKEAHQAFVSGLSGSSVYVVILVGISSVLCSWTRRNVGQLVTQQNWWISFILDTLFFTLPSLCVLCYPYEFSTYGVTILALFNIFAFLQNKKNNFKKISLQESNKLSCISYYRSSLLLMTAIAILAVDFPIFPREFAKTETYGYSVMDIGVASFVFSNAMVSKSARLVAKTDFVPESSSIFKKLLLNIKSSSPLLFLGFIRLFSTKATDYQEHVSEYGVHWNFFFTLCIVSFLVTLINPSIQQCLWLSLVITAGYQLALYLGLENWILNAPRENLLSMNKEGVCSFLGFLSISLFGTWVGSLFFLDQHRKHRVPFQLVKQLFAIDVVCWVAFYALSLYIEPSRRMANVTYVAFSHAYNILLVLFFKVIDELTVDKESMVISGFQRNGLFMFLIANLCTGAVNLSMKTIYASNSLAFIILSGYCFFLTCVATFLHIFNITLKFW